MILLFLSGLETNIKMFLKYSVVGLMVGLGGVLVSFVLGDLCAVFLLPKFFTAFAAGGEHALAGIPLAEAMTKSAPLYMGIMSTATSVGITARILSEKKKMDSEEGVTIMAGAVIDDVLGLIVLAVGNGIIAAHKAAETAGTAAGGMDWGEIGLVALKAFGVWLGATVVALLAARWIAKFLKKAFKSPVVIATMAFGLALALAGFFEYMGLAMIIGAYVMGLALSRTDLKHPIQEMLTPVYTFLVPVFFCSMGMMVDVRALCSEPVLIFGGIYTAVAVASKVFGWGEADPAMLADPMTVETKLFVRAETADKAADTAKVNAALPGCTFAVRKSFCEKLAPCWDAGLPHDAMLWRSALAAGSAAIYHKELITWRRYDSSSSNPNSASDQYEDKKRLMLDFYVENCSSHLLYLEKLRSLIEQGSLSVSERTDRILRESEAFEQAWKDALSSHNALRLAGDILRYRRFFLSVRNALYQAYISLRTRQSARKLP